MSDFLPGLGPVKTTPTTVQGSMADAARPWQAAAGVGEQLMGVGDKLASVYVKQKETEAKREMLKMQMEYEQISQAYEMEMLKNPNLTPEQAAEGWKQATASFSSKWDNPEMSPMMRDMVGTKSKMLVSRGGHSVAKTSTLAFIQNTKQEGLNAIQLGVQSGDIGMMQQGIDLYSQYAPEADVTKVSQVATRDLGINVATNHVQSDPYTSLHLIDSDWDRYKSENPGVTDDLKPKFRSMADSAVKRDVSRTYDEFYDGVAEDTIKTAEDIRLKYGHKPPRVVADMISKLDDMNDVKEGEYYDSEAGRKAGKAELQGLYKDLKTAGGEEYITKLGRVKYLHKMIGDDPYIMAGKERIGVISQERTADRGDKMTRFASELDDMILPGELGEQKPQPERQKVSSIIRGGFLRDQGKMDLFFPDDQLNKDMKAQKEKLLDPETSATERREIFQAMYPNRITSGETPESIQKAAEAIWKGHSEIDWISPARQAEWERKQTRANAYKAEIMEAAATFLKENGPDAPYEEIKKAAMGAMDDPENSAYSDLILGK